MPKELTKAVVMDLLASLGLPTSTADELFRRYWTKRAAEVREILLEEIAQGAAPLIAASEDDGIEIVVRVVNASIAGSARINLRLMAKVLAGLGKHSPIYASNFAKYQRVLQDLSREEIIFLATLHRITFDNTTSPLTGTAYSNWENTAYELVPGVFPTEQHMRAIAYSAQRSGLLMGAGAMEDGSTYLRPSPLMAEVANLASFEEALKQEPDPRADRS